MKPFVLIIACSSQKAPVEKAPAKDLYTGNLFIKARKLAEMHNVPYWILSAKYGIIMPDDVIETYDQKFKKPYDGPMPPEPYYGFCVGGWGTYFKNFPDRFLPITSVEGWTGFGPYLKDITDLVKNPEEAYKRLASHPGHGDAAI